MHLWFSDSDWISGGACVGAFLPVALIGYPLAFRNRHSEELRDALPLKCVAMHVAGCMFVFHDWLAWHNAHDACVLLCIIQVIASTSFYCTLLWKHHSYYVRHVAAGTDGRIVVLILFGVVAFFIFGVVRLALRFAKGECERLDAAFAVAGALQLAAGLALFHRVGRFPGARNLLHIAIRVEIVVAFIAVLNGFLKQFDDAATMTVIMLGVMSFLFNATFLLFLLPLCVHRKSITESDTLDSDMLYDSQHSVIGVNNTSGRSRHSNTTRIADHFQGRYEKVVQKIIKKIKDGRSEKTVLSELENVLTSSNVPMKLLVNAREQTTERTMLHYACAAGHSQVVARLFEYGDKDLEQPTDTRGYEPLHCAVAGHESVDLEAPNRTLNYDEVSAIVAQRCDIIQALIKNGANINAALPDGRRPLHFALLSAHALPPAESSRRSSSVASSGYLSVFDFLIHLGAKQEPANPANELVTMNSTTSISISGGLNDFSERHDLEWHHVVMRNNVVKKTPISLAVEADDAMKVVAVLKHVYPSCAASLSSGRCAISSASRRAGLTCLDCGSASLLHIALANNAAHTVETLLRPSDYLVCEEAVKVMALVRPMIGSRTETSHGMTVFHAAAIAGNPAMLTLILTAIITPPSGVSPVPRGEPAFPSLPPSPRAGIGAGQNSSAPVMHPSPGDGHLSCPVTPVLMSPMTHTSVVTLSGEGPIGGVSLPLSPVGSRAWHENEGRLQSLLESVQWNDMTNKPCLPRSPFPPSSTKGTTVARREAAIKVLKGCGLHGADRFIRLLETRHTSVDEVVASADELRAEAFAKLSATTSRAEPSRTSADTVIIASSVLVQFFVAKSRPHSASSRVFNPSRGDPATRTPANRGLAPSPSTGGRSGASTATAPSLLQCIKFLLESRAYEFGQQYGDLPPMTALDLAASRGHTEMCRALAALLRFVTLAIEHSPSNSSAPPQGGGAASDGGGASLLTASAFAVNTPPGPLPADFTLTHGVSGGHSSSVAPARDDSLIVSSTVFTHHGDLNSTLGSEGALHLTSALNLGPSNAGFTPGVSKMPETVAIRELVTEGRRAAYEVFASLPPLATTPSV